MLIWRTHFVILQQKYLEYMKDDHYERSHARIIFIGVALAFVGAVISLVGAVSVYIGQAKIGNSPLWPLPGLVLLIWALLGVNGLVAAYLSTRQDTASWERGLWLISGAFIPIIILGALSIGPYVFITFLLLSISALILAFTRRTKWLVSLGWLVLGAVLDLGVLLLVISLGGSPS
jgi:hypothetical protein